VHFSRIVCRDQVLANPSADNEFVKHTADITNFDGYGNTYERVTRRHYARPCYLAYAWRHRYSAPDHRSAGDFRSGEVCIRGSQ